MGGETQGVSEMAEHLAKDLFNTFYWQLSGPWNQNWPCEDTAGHKTPDKLAKAKPNKGKVKANPTHPSDVVFYYDEPYSVSRTYVNCDLKSYKGTSITASSIRGAMVTLANALTCAEKSETWRDRHVHAGVDAKICGLLFVYNHDGVCNKAFDDLLSTMNNDKLAIPEGSKIVVFGPRDVRWLDNVHHEILRLRGKKEVPLDPELSRFYYPDLVLKKNVQFTSAATLEALCAPWLVLKHRQTSDAKEDVLVFYKGSGESDEEFLYLIDYLKYTGLIDKGVVVRVRTLEPHPEAAAFFGKAIEEYVRRFKGGVDLADMLKAIEYKQVNNVRTQFSTVEIGMKIRG